MRAWLTLFSLALGLQTGPALAQRFDSLSPEVRKYVPIGTPKIVLEHVKIIDGTGAAPIADRNVYVTDGVITAISAGMDEPARDGTTNLDLRGFSVMPGIVGMHDPLYYLARPNLAPDRGSDSPSLFLPMSFSAPRLYLANGVTTIRTAGGVDPYTDLKLKRGIEAGSLLGPHLDVTGAYLDGPGNRNLQMQELRDAEDARQTVAYWADRGVTSFKAYAHITRAELRAAVTEAHKRGLKITGHLCSVTYQEAAEIGIDNLEHGFFVNTQLDPDKKPDACTSSAGDYTLEHMPADSDAARQLFALLIKHHVAITSTLSNTASSVTSLGILAGRPVLPPAALQAMAPALKDAVLYERNRAPSQALPGNAFLLRREMDLERAFVAAGGLLLAGPDGNGIGGIIPGFGDHRQIELLVEGGFTPVQAIRIATLNGAIYLGRQETIGAVAVGKHADLVVMRGDPAAQITDIENVTLVFKDGVGYDTNALLASVRGRYGEY